MDLIDAMETSARHAEQYAARVRQAVAVLKGETQQQKKTRRKFTSAAADPYADLWTVAQTLPDGFTGGDFGARATRNNRAYNAINSWKRRGLVEQHIVDGVYEGWRLKRAAVTNGLDHSSPVEATHLG